MESKNLFAREGGRLTHGSLFSGISKGGFDLAAEWMGWENVFHCEIDPFCCKLLKQNFPGVPNHGDIKTFSAHTYSGSIDILSGGFPCKQTSVAASLSGNRHGLMGVDSSLWYEYLRVAQEIRSCWIVVENVAGVKKWDSEIKAGLEALGYTVSRLERSAADYGLPHKRKRYIYVANADGQRLEIARQTGSPALTWFKRLATARGNWLSGTPGVIGSFNGLPDRVDRIKALGNALVPQIAYEIFKAISLTQQIK